MATSRRRVGVTADADLDRVIERGRELLDRDGEGVSERDRSDAGVVRRLAPAGLGSLEDEREAEQRRRLALVERFATGDGVDLDLIRDPDRTLRR